MPLKELQDTEEIPIYEKLAVDEILIILRDKDNRYLIAENHDGEVVIKWVSIEKTRV